MTQATNDNIYLNINTEAGKRSVFAFDENRVQPVLDNPSHYELAVIRFSVPTDSIPIMNWRNDRYKIGIEFNGTLIERFVEFVPYQTPGLPPFYPNTIGQIWSYPQWCDNINNTLKLLHDDMVLAEPTFPATKEILLKIKPVSSIMSLYCENGYTDPNVKVYFNFDLYSNTFFQSYQVSDDKYQVIIKDRLNNTTTYGGGGVIMTQEYETTALISELDKIIFETNSIPVNPELLGSATNETRQVITDFDCAGFSRDRTDIQYYPQGPVRYYQLKSTYPLHRVDLTVSWEDRRGNSFPLFLEYNNQITIKLHFRKKGSDIMLTALNHDDEESY
jgi:hypothetical protein